MNIFSVYVTFASNEEAQKICRDLVEKKIVACANILASHTAIYEWDHEVHEHQEVAAILKTTKDRLDDVTSAIKSLHSYDEPCIVFWKVEGGSFSFLNWIFNQTKR